MSAREPRHAVDAIAAALRKKDAAALVALYSPDVVAFDLAPPLVRRGVAEIRQRAEQWFAQFEGEIGYELRDARLEVADDVAFYSGLHHIDARTKDGGAVDMWIRMSLGLVRRDGAWTILHEHVSVPFDMTTFKALLDAKP